MVVILDCCFLFGIRFLGVLVWYGSDEKRFIFFKIFIIGILFFEEDRRVLWIGKLRVIFLEVGVGCIVNFKVGFVLWIKYFEFYL